MYRRKSVVTLQSEASPNDPPSPSPMGSPMLITLEYVTSSSPLTPSRGSRYTNLRKARFVSPPFTSVSNPFQVRSPPPPPTDTYSDVINIGLPPSEGEGFKIVLQAIEQSGERGNQYIFKLRQTSSSTLAKPVGLYEKLKTEKLGIAKMETPPRMIKRGVRFSPPLKEKFIRV